MATATVEEQIAAVLNGEQFNYPSRFDAIIETLALAQTALAERDAQIAEMRKVTGPKCPRCDHWLKAEHFRRYRDKSGVYDSFKCEPCAAGMQEGISKCDLPLIDLLMDHPLIAAELGLEASDGE